MRGGIVRRLFLSSPFILNCLPRSNSLDIQNRSFLFNGQMMYGFSSYMDVLKNYALEEKMGGKLIEMGS